MYYIYRGFIGSRNTMLQAFDDYLEALEFYEKCIPDSNDYGTNVVKLIKCNDWKNTRCHRTTIERWVRT